MIRTLRRAHLRIWIALAILLPLLLAASLYERRDTTPLNPKLHWGDYK